MSRLHRCNRRVVERPECGAPRTVDDVAKVEANVLQYESGLGGVWWWMRLRGRWRAKYNRKEKVSVSTVFICFALEEAGEEAEAALEFVIHEKEPSDQKKWLLWCRTPGLGGGGGLGWETIETS